MTFGKADLGSLYNLAVVSCKVNDHAKQGTALNLLF